MVAVSSKIELRGAVARLAHEWWKHDEIIIRGPAGTGKSLGIAFIVDDLACQYPECRIAIIRKTRVSLTQSFCKTFRKAMLMRGDRDHLFIGRTDATRDVYSYRNGTELVLGGMDNPTRLFSTEYDFIFVNECNELTEDEWQSLHRAMRAGSLPRQVLVGDCNPDTEFHWSIKRIRRGLATLFESYHRDNPWFETEAGRRYYERMRDRTTGVIRKRLFEGVPASASGAVYPQFSVQTHVIKGGLVKRGAVWKLEITSGFGAVHGAPKEIEVVAFLAGQDWGWRAPGCLQVWAVTADGRLFLVREWYHTEKLRTWFASNLGQVHEALGVERAICDCADPEAIQVFNNFLSWDERAGSDPIAIGSDKTRLDGRTNIDLVRDRLMDRADGYPGVFFLENALQHSPDPYLEDASKPTRTHEEFPGYVLEEVQTDREGREKEDRERPRRVNNHGINATEYVVRYAHGRKWDAYQTPLRIPKGSFAAKHGFTPETHPHIFGLDEPPNSYEYVGDD